MLVQASGRSSSALFMVLLMRALGARGVSRFLNRPWAAGDQASPAASLLEVGSSSASRLGAETAAQSLLVGMGRLAEVFKAAANTSITEDDVSDMPALNSTIEEIVRSMTLDEAIGAASLPQDVTQLLRTTRGKQPPEKLKKDAIDRATATLNGKISKAQLRLDLKRIECNEFTTRSWADWQQVTADITRISAELARLEGSKVANLAATSSADQAIQALTEQQESAAVSFKELKAKDDPVLALRKEDLNVAAFMLEIAKCKGGRKKKKTKALLVQHGRAGGTARVTLHGAIGTAAGHVVDGANRNSKADAGAGSGGVLGSGAVARAGVGEAKLEHGVRSTHLEACEDEDGRVNFTFDDPSLANSTSKLSPRGMMMMKEVLKASHLSDSTKAATAVLGAGLGYSDLDDGDEEQGVEEDLLNFAAQRSNQSNPYSDDKLKSRCASSEPDCGVLHDSLSMLYGEMKDLVDAMVDKMEKDERRWKSQDADFNTQLAALATKKAELGSALGDIMSRVSAAQQEQVLKHKQMAALAATFTSKKKECKIVVRDIIFDEICGSTKVRNELLISSLGLKEEEITDCEVTKWTHSVCSKTCADDGVGGVQKLTREVVVKPKKYGSPCPSLNMSSPCGKSKCPVDCHLSDFSEYSTCTKMCGGGVQTRLRSVLVKPKNGGKACDVLQETRPCNAGSCDRDCTLSDWTAWSPCSQACDGGVTERKKTLVVPKRGDGVCPRLTSRKRLERKDCNAQPCVGDEICVGHQEVTLLIDGSGSLTSKGFDILKEYAATMVKQFANKSYGNSAVRVSVVQFGNGHLRKDNSITDAILVSPLSSDMSKVEAVIKNMKWQRGFTNMAQGLLKANTQVKKSRRRDASSVVVMITDGKPSFKRQAIAAAKEVRVASKLIVAHVKSFPTDSKQSLMQSFASAPTKRNYFNIPGKSSLKADYKGYATKLLVKLCTRAESPKMQSQQVKQKGFKLWREGQACAVGPNATEQDSPESCAAAADAVKPWSTFEFEEPASTPPGVTTSGMPTANMGKCRVMRKRCKVFKKVAKTNVYRPAKPFKRGRKRKAKK